MKRRQRRPVLELNKAQSGSHGDHLQNKYKQINSEYIGQNVPANPLANLLCHYNSDSDTEDSKKDVHKLDDQVNNFLKEIQLIAPKESVSSDSSNSALTTTTTVQSTHHVNQPEQPMWRECVDESSGYPYYWHVETNEVTWEIPKELQLFKSGVKLSSVVQQAMQESHWFELSSIAYQQSHENIPEGMIPREVVARNRNRFIRNETTEKQNSQVDPDAANTSDAMDDDSEDGKIEMITSYGSDESDSDTTDPNHSSNEIPIASTSESTPPIKTKTKIRNTETLSSVAPITLPHLSKTCHKPVQEYDSKSILSDTRTDGLQDAKMIDEKDSIKNLRNQAKQMQRSIDDEHGECSSKSDNRTLKDLPTNTCEENLAKKDIHAKINVDSDLDFRISLVPGYDEDSDGEEEIDVKEERKALFPIPQDEIVESISLSHRSTDKQVIQDDERINDSNDGDTNASATENKNTESQDGEVTLEKSECGEESIAKTEDEAQKSNIFLDNLRGRNKCFQRKKRIAFDVPSAKVKTCEDVETTKVENEPQQSEPNACKDVEQPNIESQKELRADDDVECNETSEDTIDSVKSNFKDEPNSTEEQTAQRCDTPTDSKEDEEEVNLLTQIILEKLKFLSEGKPTVSPVQMMAIQLQTLFVAWEGGFLEKSYLRRWLTDTSHELERLEQDAAPPGWLCQWDRSHKRYYYQNATTGVTQWTYPDPGIAGGTEEMEICSTPPPVEQEEVASPVEAEPKVMKPKKSKEDEIEASKRTTDARPSDIEPPPPPQISNPSPPPPPRIYAEDLKKDKRKRDKIIEKLAPKKKRLGEEATAMTDVKLLDNPSVSAAPLSPQSSAISSMANTEPLPPGVDLTEASYEIPATALKRIIYSAVQPQGNPLYEATARDPTVPILGHPAALVQEHYLQYPAYHHLHAPAALVLPHKPAIQLISDYTPIYTNHKVIEKPPVKMAKESLVSALDSFYSDIALMENSGSEQQVSQRQEVAAVEPSSLPVEEVKVDVEPEPALVETVAKEKKKKKARIGISKKHKEVSSMVAKWQKAQQNFEDNT